MSGDEKDAEPLYAQVPTAELKRILSERFAREVSSAAWARMWRALAFLGLPGVAAAGGLLWTALDTKVASRIDEQRTKVEAGIKEDVNREVARRWEVLDGRVEKRVSEAFKGEYGQAVQDRLRAALDAPAFQDELRGKVRDAVLGVWAQENEPLRRGFLEQVTANRQFLDALAKQVAQVMAESRTVPDTIAESLETYLQGVRAEDAGRDSAVALLAAMDQARANAAVSYMLDEGGRLGRRGMALQGLQHVSFAGLRVGPGDAVKMLDAALSSWSAHCAATDCAANTDSMRGLESFLARGQQLPATERAAWVSMLAVWHEELLRGDGRARRASVYLVPRALGAIGTPEARSTLVRWFTSGETELALSAAMAVGSQAAASLPDAERLALFKGLWPKDAAPDTRRALLAEAEWMALGRISDGRADPAGAFRPEAVSIRSRPPQAGGRRWEITRWADAQPVDFARQRAPRPPAEPCTIGAEAPPTQHRAELCVLAALIRPEGGAAEWSALRQLTLWQEDEVAMLGLLWTIQASRAAEGALGAEARLAPLPDLLRSRARPPAAWELPAMLLLRASPEQAAWQALGQLRPKLEEAPLFAVASRWLFRPWAVTQAWFVERLRELPNDTREAVLREIAAAAVPPEEVTAEGPLVAAVGRLSLPGFAALNALHFTHAAAPDAAVAAVERGNGFRLLQDSAAGNASGGGAQAGVAGDLLAALLDRAGWSRAVVAMAPDSAEPPLAGPRTPLTPVFEGRFGRLRLSGGDTLTLEPSEAGKASSASAPVTFYNPRTRETRVLGTRESWRLPGFAAEEWMFRLGAGGPAMQLVAAPAETLVLVGSASAPALPAVEEGRTYTVVALPDDPGRPPNAARAAGWARIPWVRAGDRVRASTFDLAENVDTIVEVHHGTAEPERDDDGGDGLASRLEWTAEAGGEALVRFINIGAPGAFRLKVERLPRATTAEVATIRAQPASPPSRPR
ncbi:MAG: hypothetical protein ICV73_10305 [Acetobacteraceae bacterium]|nr:hypothetical protein [Acetobacteraceae bacterium]